MAVSTEAIQFMRKKRFIIMAVCCVAYFFVIFHRVSPAVMATQILAAFNATPAVLGLWGSMFFYSYGLSQLPAGIMADRWGARRTLTVFLCVAGLGSILFGMASNFEMTMLGRFLTGLGLGFVFTPVQRIIADWYSRGEAATVNGLFTSCGVAGQLCASLPLAWAMTLFSWRSIMIAIGLFTIGIAAAAWIVIRNHPREAGAPELYEIDGTAPVSRGPGLSLKASFQSILGTYNWRLCAFIHCACLGLPMAFTALWIGPYLKDVCGMAPLQAASFIATFAVATAIASPLLGFMSDRLGNRKIVILVANVLLCAGFAGMAALGQSITPTMLVLCLAGMGIGCGVAPTVFICTRENVDGSVGATAVGLSNCICFALVVPVFQSVMAFFIEQAPVVDGVRATSGYTTALWVYAAVVATAILVFSTLRPQK